MRSGDWINNGTVGGDPTACMDALADRLGGALSNLQDIEIWDYGKFYPQLRFQEIDPLQSGEQTGRQQKPGVVSGLVSPEIYVV